MENYGVHDGPGKQGSLSFKLIHLIYVVIALILVIAGIFTYMAFFLPHTATAQIGNGWTFLPTVQPLIVNGRAYMTFIGAEFCEYCAVERFAVFSALSNFGNWTYYGKTVTTNTLPVYNTTNATEPQNDALFFKAAEGDWTINFLNPHLQYSSSFVDFSSVEVLNNAYNPLQQMNALQSSYTNKYDPAGAVPFIVIGGNFYIVGPGKSLAPNGVPIIFDSAHVGYPPSYIINQVNQTGSPINIAFNMEVDYISAILCHQLNNAPHVCSVPSISAIEAKIK